MNYQSPIPLGEKIEEYTIGITIFVNGDGRLGLFENGARQNVFFLYNMFKSSPNCKEVFLLNHGDGEPSENEDEGGIPKSNIVRSKDVIDRLDYVIVLGAMPDRDTVAELKKRSVPVISYKAGNDGVFSMESMAANPPRDHAERYNNVDYYDAIWMTPQHLHTYRGWAETVFRVPVYEIPQIWSPFFIDNRPEVVRKKFGYKSGRKKWRLGVMDPNITIMKTSHMPILACEAAFRSDPKAIEAIYVTNSLQFKENSHFQAFVSGMEAAKAGCMTIEQRFVSADFLADHCDAVVTHHWENGLNYLYYEVIYGGYPLIHNSEFLKEYGYYYPSFDALAGGKAIENAMKQHDKGLEQYRRNSKQLFAQLDPASEKNVQIHEGLLLSAKEKALAA